MKKEIINTAEFESVNNSAIAKVTTKSPLQVAAQDLKTSLEACRSVSSYFRELRRNAVEKEGQTGKVQTLLREYTAKGKKFSPEKLHDILNVGNMQPILEADDFLQSKRKTPMKVWSGARMQTAFLRAIAVE